MVSKQNSIRSFVSFNGDRERLSAGTVHCSEQLNEFIKFLSMNFIARVIYVRSICALQSEVFGNRLQMAFLSLSVAFIFC